jgi:hypothetical protein
VAQGDVGDVAIMFVTAVADIGGGGGGLWVWIAVMLKEIMSQPVLLGDCMRGRVLPGLRSIRLGGLEREDTMTRLVNAKRIIICACGTSFHSGLVGEVSQSSSPSSS